MRQLYSSSLRYLPATSPGPVLVRGLRRYGLLWLLGMLPVALHAQSPTVTRASLAPAANARAAARNTAVVVPFSQAIDPATAGNIKIHSQQYRGQRTATAGTSGSTVTLTPTAGSGSAAFQPGERVFVTVPTSVQSTTGVAATRHVYQFTAATTSGSGAFGGGSDPAVGRNPYSVALGDVDGDGDLDLLTANYNAGSVSVRLNDGTGSFSGGSNPAVSGSPISVALGDVDGDGDLDFVATNSYYLGNTVSVRLNDGTGSFGGGSDPAVNGSSSSVALGDVDSDGDLDLLATHNNGTVSVRLNDGAGSFGGGSNPTVSGSPASVALGDLDGDGDLDFVTANAGGFFGTASVRLNDGTGTFGGGSNPSVGPTPTGVALGDLDGDGDLDFVTANNSNLNTASVRLNDGSGSFIAPAANAEPTVGFYPGSVALGDVDGDGDLDFAVANSTFDGTVSVRLNQQTPTISSFTPPNGPVATSVVITGTSFGGATAVAFNGISASYTVNSDTQITALVPNGATTGPISVTGLVGSTTSTTDFIVDPSLLVTGLNPARNARAAARNTTVQLSFSANVNPATAGNIKIFSQQYRGRRTATVNVSGSSVTLTPTGAPAAGFKPGETVFVTVPTSVSSTGGLAALRHVYQFTAAATGGSGAFGGGSNPAVGANPVSVATGDVDGDGDLDFVTANQANTGTVSVRLNDGAGSFSGGSNPAVGAEPRSVALGDVDGDGDLDILTANAGSTASVRLNNGAGIFTAPATNPNPAIGDNPSSVAVGDVDGDGDLDLLTGHAGFPGTVSVRLNNGAGSFSGGSDLTVAEGFPSVMVTLGDVDGDGDLDLLTGNAGFPGTVSVRLNNGVGGFSGGSNLTVGGSPVSVALGDVDGDGDLDFVSANTDNNTVNVRLNDGAGSFSGGSNPAVGGSPTSVTLGDVDGDGDLDVLTANAGSGTVSVRLNNGAGTFTAPATNGNPAVGGSPRSLALGDVDGDGDLDILTANAGGTASVRLNQQTPTISSFTPPNGTAGTSVVITGTSFGVVTAVAFNGTPTSFTVDSDTQLTALVPNGATTGRIRVTNLAGLATSATDFIVNPSLLVTGVSPARNARAAARNTAVQLSFSANVNPATAGNIKVFSQQYLGQRTTTVNTSGSSVTLTPTVPAFKPGETVSITVPATVQSTTGLAAFRQVYQFTAAATGGTGSFGGSANPAVGNTPFSVATGDVDGDGDLDFVTANNGSGTASVRLNDGSGTFSGGSNPTVGTNPRSVALGDVDGDGDLDILTANYGSAGNPGTPGTGAPGTVSVRLNNGAGTFSGGSTTTVGIEPRGVTVGDVDGDGDLDLLTANNDGTGTVSIRLNNGAGTFSGGSTTAVGGTPSNVVLGDVDGDGDLDLLTANSNNPGTVSVRLNNGLGVFSGGSDPAVSDNPRSVAVGDVDGDGDLDFVAGGWGSNRVSVRLNNGLGVFSSSANPTVGALPRSVTLGDVDGDGDLDVLTVSETGNTVSVRLNNGAGVFSVGSDPAVGTTPFGLALGDLDGDGDLDILTANNSATGTVSVRLNQAPPVISSFTPTSGSAGTSVVITGGGFLGVTAVQFNGLAAASFTVNSGTQITAIAPNGLTTGPLSVTNSLGTATSTTNFTVGLPDLVISTSGQSIAAGTFNSITINSGGEATLTGNVTVNSSVTVNDGGTLSSGCFLLSGPASFTLAASGTLRICHVAGITTTGSTGDVQTTGLRSFSDDATYLYNGTQAQVTGNGLPATVRELGVNNTAGLTLTQAVQVRQRVNVLAGNLALNGRALTLLSTSSGTALVANMGGIVSGPTGTMQRHIETNTLANGYRHYSSPVSGETLSTLATAGYTPNFSGGAAYNSSPRPGQVRPFPTVFAYDQDRIPTTVSNYDLFSKGFVAPTTGAAPMEVGRGYSVNAPGSALVDFTGTFTTGNVTRSNLNRTGLAEAGWQLLGNPYPSPIDWSTLTLGAGNSLENLDGAVYVFQSSGTYTGSYRTYQNGLGGTPLIPAGSGFFVRTTTPGVPGTLRLSNANRVTTFGAQPHFGRPTVDLRPQLALTLTNAPNTLADETILYAEAGATGGVDAVYDATKMGNPNGLSLALVAATGEALAIDGRPAFTVNTLVPLQVVVPVAGPYTLHAATLANLPAGMVVYLRDAATGQQTDLSQQPSTTLTLAAGLSTRFSLVFAPAGPLASAPALTPAQVVLYPNPAHKGASVTVALPAPSGSPVTLEVLNMLGQVVRAPQRLSVAAGQATGTVSTTGLATGVYTLRLTTGSASLSKRLVLE